MKTYPISDKDRAPYPFAFEIENAYVSLGTVVSILCALEGVSAVRRRRIFSAPSEIHIRFLLKGKEYVVWEPYGDNSRYWIGPDEHVDPTDISALISAFDKHRPSRIAKLFGDLISLNLRGLLGRDP